MAQLIRNGEIEPDRWRRFEAVFESITDTLPPDEFGWMVSLTTLITQSAAVQRRLHSLGVVLQPDDDANDLFNAYPRLCESTSIAFIAIDFPVYTDGRGFSLAQILRQQFGWRGELRALGDVLIDTVHYLYRCGFDSFALKQGHDPKLALKALHASGIHYQSAYADR